MSIWTPKKLGIPSQTFIKYRNTQESYEKLFRVGEGIYSETSL